MATLESTIVLTDKMSPVLEKLQRQARYMMSTLEKMNKASKNPIDPKGFEAAAQEMRETDAAIISLKEDMEKLNRQSKNTGEGMKGFGGIVQGMIQGVGMGISNKIMGAFSLDTVKSIAATSDAMVSVNAKVKMLTKSEDEFNELQDKIRKSAKASRSEYMETAEAVANLGMLAGDAFSNNDEIIKFTEAVGKSFTLSGADAGTKAGATRQLVQALGSGVLRGDELNSIMEGAPIIVEMIAKKLGVAKGEIRQLAAEGKLTGEVVKSAMIDGLDEINDRYAKMPATWESVSADLKNQMLYAFQPALDMVNDIANSERFKKMMEAAGPMFAKLAGMAISIMKGLASAGGFIVENWRWVKPIVYTVMGYMAAMKLSSWEMATKGLPAMNLQFSTMKTTVATIKTNLISMQGLLGVLISGALYAWDLSNRVMENQIKFDENGKQRMSDEDAKELKDINLKNRFQTQILGLKKGGAMVKNWWNYGRGELSTEEFHEANARTREYYNEQGFKLDEKYNKRFESATADYSALEQSKKDLADMMKNNDKWQKDLENAIKGANGGAGAPPSSPKPPKYEQQKQNTLDKIAKDTGAMRKRMELSESDMELIRKLATRQIVAKGTSAKIQIVNNNNISNMGDAKAVVQMLTSQISEAAAVGAAGG